MKWPVVSFNSLFLEPQRNGIHKPKEFHGSGTKIVNMGELFAFRFVGAQPMKRLQLEGDESTRFGLENGDLLFARRSLIESGAGKCVVVEKLNEAAVFESSLIRVRLDPTKCDSRFYFYYFQDQPGRGEIEAIITGAAQKGIRGSELAEIDVHEPPLPTQRKIASILSAYDDLIENNTRRITILEEMAQSLYREWFVEYRFPGHEEARFVDSLLGKIPEGWHQHLGDVITLKRGYDLPQRERRAGAVPLVSSSGITDFHDEAMVKGPGVVTGRYGTLGDVFYVPEDFWPLNTTLYVQNFKGNEPLLIVQLLRSLNLGSQNAAGAVPGVNRNALHLLDVAFPPDTIQERIASAFEALERGCRNLRLRSENLRTTRDLLLPKLMTGQVDVEDLDIDIGESLAEADA